MKNLRGLSGLMVIVAIMLLFSGFSDLSCKMKKPVDINTVTAGQLKAHGAMAALLQVS